MKSADAKPVAIPPDMLALYEALSPEQKQWLAIVNFLAEEIKDNLLVEQFLLAVDILTDRLQKLNPQIACVQGCSRCCERYALPELTESEWLLLKESLECLPCATQERIRMRLRAIPSDWFDASGWPRHPRQAYAQFSCPLLEEGRCLVYARRPFACRAMGYFFTRRQPGERPLPPLLAQLLTRKTPIPLTCHEEQQRIQQELTQPEKMLLYAFIPVADQFMAALASLDGHPERKQLLVSRLLAWAGLENAPTGTPKP